MLGGVETALWDIFGKLTGQLLYYLLGGYCGIAFLCSITFVA